MPNVKSNSNIAYHGVSLETSEDEHSLRPKFELGEHPQLAKERRWTTTLLFQAFCFSWLAPISALLYLNLSGYVIGASAWCPNNCWVDAWNSVTSVPQENMVKFDRNDHNLLGALQLVAKALEVWFVIISVALVYLVTMRFASKEEGLPIGYFTRMTDFTEIITLIDPLPWRTAPPLFGDKSRETKIGRRVWFLLALTVILCVLCNLMGPATAVLVIPSLQWITTESVGDRAFLSLNSGSPPGSDDTSWFSNATGALSSWTSPCSQQAFALSNYTCTQDPFGRSLDAWIESSIASRGAIGLAAQTDFVARMLTFTVNETVQSASTNTMAENNQPLSFKDYTFWVPSRQVISDLSVDLAVVQNIAVGWNQSVVAQILPLFGEHPGAVGSYLEYNKSLELRVQRNGPIIGFLPVFWTAYNGRNHRTTYINESHQLRCYEYYNLAATPFVGGSEYGYYTKCIRVGSGWSTSNKKASFFVPGPYAVELGQPEIDIVKMPGPGVSIDIYSSDRAVFFHNGSLPSWLPSACLNNGTVLSTINCDWHRVFTTPESPHVANRTSNVITIEMTMDTGSSSFMMVVDFVAFSAFTMYSLDTSPISNPMGIVQTLGLPTHGTSIPIDPDWILAGWSAESNQSIAPQRTATIELLQAMTVWSSVETATAIIEVMNAYLIDGTLPFGPYYDEWLRMSYITFLPIAHALSLIDYNTISGDKGLTAHEEHPLLQRNARMYVWGYFMASRTSILGIIVALGGCLVVLAQGYLGFVERRRYRSSTQLLVAALEHVPRGDFEGKWHDEKAMAKIRFHVEDLHGRGVEFSPGKKDY